MDVLAFSGAGSTRDRVDVRGHSVRQQIRFLGSGPRLRRSGDRVHGQDSVKPVGRAPTGAEQVSSKSY